MELGRPPAFVAEVRSRRGRAIRGRRESYNCHHVVPKSVRPESDAVSINHPTNFVVAKTTRRGLDQSENPHHFWHSLFLHPQTHNAPAEPIPDLRCPPICSRSILRSPRVSATSKNFAKSWQPWVHLSYRKSGKTGFWNFRRPRNTSPTLFRRNFMRSLGCSAIFTKRKTRIRR